ncbi:hypothetical protein M0R45_031962 [Rubus argutus]|uniref:Uncharacterized protein n=1 Tax=Rubus argutus TaxID=59490 RepID=A0AAW1WJQ7_RUBAR
MVRGQRRLLGITAALHLELMKVSDDSMDQSTVRPKHGLEAEDGWNAGYKREIGAVVMHRRKGARVVMVDLSEMEV